MLTMIITMKRVAARSETIATASKSWRQWLWQWDWRWQGDDSDDDEMNDRDNDDTGSPIVQIFQTQIIKQRTVPTIQFYRNNPNDDCKRRIRKIWFFLFFSNVERRSGEDYATFFYSIRRHSSSARLHIRIENTTRAPNHVHACTRPARHMPLSVWPHTSTHTVLHLTFSSADFLSSGDNNAGIQYNYPQV